MFNFVNMKRRNKKQKSIFDIKVNLTIDESLKNVKPSPFEMEKLARAKEHLKGIKLPK